MPALRIVVRGHVQGVGFRYFVSRRAESLGIRGEVWNRRDGGVEAVAEHDDSATLEEFAEALRSGPGYVESIEKSLAVDVGFGGFTIGPTR